MNSDKHFIDQILQGPPQIKQFEMCSHFKTKDGTCYECRLESERDRLQLELEEANIKHSKAIRLLMLVTDILSMDKTPDRAGVALNEIYKWLHENNPVKEDTKDGI